MKTKKAQFKTKQVSWQKKGQLKIQEMAFMLVVIVLFFILVGLFVMSIIYLNLHKSASRAQEEKTLSAIVNLADSSEFTYGEPNCVDEDKTMALSESKTYNYFWDFSSLKILKQSGFDKKENELIKCTHLNYPDCDLIVIYDKNVDNEDTTKSFVGLCRKDMQENVVYDKCEIAEFIAGAEIQIAGK